MATSTPASTSGTLMATTMPARQPRLAKLTSSTMPSAARKLAWKSAMSAATTADWSFSGASATPSGRVGRICATCAATWRPSSRTLPPSAMLMPRPSAGRPSTRMVEAGGSATVRAMAAKSPRRSRWPPPCTGSAASAAGPSSAGRVQTRMRSVAVSTKPLATTLFSWRMAASTSSSVTPSSASLRYDTSTASCSCCWPTSATLPTPGRPTSRSRTSSATCFSSGRLKPSPVRAYSSE